MPYEALNADQRGGTGPNGKLSLTITQAAAQLDRAGLSWSPTLGQAATVTYAYRASAPATMPEDASGFQTFNYQQIRATEYALKLWSQMANITFVRVGGGDYVASGSNYFSNDATILFGDYTGGVAGADAFAILPGNRAAGSATGDVWINNTYRENSYVLTYGFGFVTLLHEIGHAIGLSHPSDYDVIDATSSFAYGADAGHFEDSLEYSVMSYFDLEDTGGTTRNGSLVAPGGPLIDDIAAVQRLYGANPSTDAGDTVYGYGYSTAGTEQAESYLRSYGGEPIWGTVWDGGGIDTFDFHNAGSAQKIDLRAGSFSDVYGATGTLSIAAGVTIENAIGGDYGDTIIGNEVANVLRGGAGNDTITGNGGNDMIDGAGGYDIAVIGASSAARLGLTASLAVTVTSSDGFDTLINIEAIRFSDRLYSIANIAPVDALYMTYGGRHGNAGELLYWNDQIVSGGSLAAVKSAIVTDPIGRVGINNAYLTWFGRDAAASEIDVWRGLIVGGADYGALKTALLNEPAGKAHVAAVVTDIYQNFFGRAPNASEVGVWQNNIVGGADFGTVRTAVLKDYFSQTYVQQRIYDSYSALAGRGASGDEVIVWQGLFAGTADLATMRKAIIEDPTNHYFGGQLNAVYEQYFGRLASSAETAVWKAGLTQSGDFETVRSALIADPGHGANAIPQIEHLYQLHLGRDASSAELGYWAQRIQAGGTFDNLRGALLSDPAAPAQISANIDHIYQTYMQRTVTAPELDFWARLSPNYDYVSVEDRVLTLSTAPVVQHATGTAGKDVFALHAGELALTIADFTPGTDVVSLSAALYGKQDVLANALEFYPYMVAGGGTTPDTLLQLDATHAILFQNTYFASLGASDFVFI